MFSIRAQFMPLLDAKEEFMLTISRRLYIINHIMYDAVSTRAIYNISDGVTISMSPIR